MFEYTDQDGNVLSESEVQKLAKEAKTKLSYYTTEKKLKRREVKAKEETSPFPKTEGLDPLGVEKMQSLSTTETTKPKSSKNKAVASIDWKSVPGINDFGSSVEDTNKLLNFETVGMTEEASSITSKKTADKVLKAEAEQKSYEEKYGDDSQRSIEKKKELLDVMDIEEPTKVHPWHLKGQDVDIVPKLNEKLNAFGIEVDNNQLSNSIVLKPIGYTAAQDGSNLYVPLSLNVGDKDNAKKINDYVSLYKNDNYLNEVKEKQKGKYEAYKKAATPKDFTHEQLVEKIQETKKKNFLSISLQKGLEAGEGSAFAKEVVLEDFSSPAEFKQYKDWVAGKKMSEPSAEELVSYDQQYKDNFITEKSNRYSSSLSKSDRKDFEILTQDLKKQGSISIYKFKKEAEDFNKVSKDYSKLEANFKNNPSVEAYNTLSSSYINLVKTQNQLQDKEANIRKYQKDYKNFVAPSIKNFSANYDNLALLTTGFKGLVSSTGVALSETAGVIATGLSPLPFSVIGDAQMDYIRKKDVYGVYDLARSLNKEKQTYQEVLGIDNITSPSDAGKWLMSSGINAIPSLSMAFTGQFALPLFFATGFGGKAEQFIASDEAAINRLKENTYLLENTNDPIEQEGIQKQIDVDKHTLAIPEWKKVTAETIYGTAEVVFELKGTMEIIKGLGKGVKYLPKKSLKEGAEWGLKNVLKTFNKEGKFEVGTRAVGNAVDVLFLGENKSLFDGFLETYAQGGLVGGTLAMIPSTNVIGQAYRSEIATKKEQREVADIVNKISKLAGVPGYNLNQALPLGRLTNEVQSMVDKLTARKDGIYAGMDERLSRGLTLGQLKQVGDINRQIRDINNDLKSVSSNSDIPPAQLKELQDQYREDFTKLIEQKENILGDPNIKADNAKAITSRNFKFDTTAGYAIYNQRTASESLQGVVNNFKTLGTEQKIELYSKTREKLLAENKNADISDNNVRKVAFEDYKNNHYKDLILKGLDNSKAYALDNNVNVDFEVFEIGGSENLVKQYENSDEYAMAAPATRKAMVAELKSGNIDATNLTFNGKPKVLIDLSVASKNLRTGVASHELLHVIVENKFKNNESSSKGKALLDYIENKDKDLFALVSQRIKSSYTKKGKNGETLYNKEGEIIKDDNYYLEVLNAMSDLAADGRKLKPTTINQIRNFLNGVLPKDFQFSENEGADVYNFVRDFNKAAHFGGKTKYNAVPLVSVGADDENPTVSLEGKTGISYSKSVEKRIDDLYDAFNAQEISDKDFETQLAILEDEEANGPSIQSEPVKKEPAKKESANAKPAELSEVAAKAKVKLDDIGNDPKGYNSKNPDIYNELGKMVKAKSRNYRTSNGTVIDFTDKNKGGLDGFNMEEMVSYVKTSMIPYIAKFDPTKNNSLYGYINAQYINRMRAALKSGEVADVVFTEDVTEEKDLMATETADQGLTETAKEKPKYKNALEAKVFPTEVLETATKKIITITRTLKTRIDAPVSLNKTVTPLISEIRDEVGNQLDIDVKTMLGGKKDGVLRKELLRTKRYVLENMTTTWLMGKDGQGGIPMAIQKQIDGKWVNFPDWVGKKIDREKTTTDQAGRTSGAELVRRLPNVANNISDEAFLAQIIGPDGNPIRGRKESLSKAMSEEVAFDIINADFAEGGPIFGAFATNQTRQGYEIANNTVVDFARQSDRGNVKFSKTYNSFPQSKKDIFNSKINQLSAALNPYLTTSSRPAIKRIFKNVFIDDFSTEEIDGLTKDFRPWLRQMRDMYSKNVAQVEDTNFNEKGNFESFIENVATMHEEGVLDVLDMKFSHESLFSPTNVKDARTTTINMFSDWVSKFGKEEAVKMMIYSGGTFKSNASLGNLIGIQINPETKKVEFSGKKGRKSNQITESAADYWDNIVYNSLPNGATAENQLLVEKIKKATAAQRKKDSASKAYKDRDFEGRKAQSLEYREIVQETFSYYFNPENEISDAAKAIMIVQMGSNMETAIRKSAILTNAYIPKAGIEAGALRYEHTRPASQVIAEILNAYKKGKGIATKEDLANIWDTYTAAVIPVSMDNNFNKAGFKSKMPPGWKKGMPTYYRYYNYATFGMKNMFAMESIDPANKEIIGEEFVKASDNAVNGIKNGPKIKAIVGSTRFSKTPKGISVFDFDDTVGLTKGSVLYTMPDGSTGKLNAEEFAKEGGNMLDAGAVFDFSEFSKVVDGKPGPMVEKMKKMIGKFGPENFFILTARPANAAGPIHEFLSSIGIDIPIENITGLGSSLAQSKADWITAKAAGGYNDFYFADDAIQNVEAVKKVLNVLDVKSKIQQAKIKFSKTLSSEFNKIIQDVSGMEDYKKFSEIVGKRRGASKNKFDFYVPPSAADFELLLYNFMGKGKEGDAHKEFFNNALLKPYANGVALMDAARQSIKREYKSLLEAFPEISSKLEKLTPDKDFTIDQALRVSIWNGAGVEIPGLSERDTKKLTELVDNDPELSAFKQGLMATSRQENGWTNPSSHWDADTIISDLYNITEGEGRKQFLREFIDNASEVFGTWEGGKLVGPNMNKIEAVYGTSVRESLEDSLYRMTNGKNKSFGADSETNKWNSWVTGSVGAIMFLNTRSAALQLTSAVNFLNFRDNNPFAAASAFANKKQYWSDFAHIFNSDKLKERRGGLKDDIQAAEIANAARGSQNKVKAVVAYMFKLGYTPTQIADSFAIASGGAPFYRNRVKSYLKEGKTEAEAEALAWQDFSKISDETQQSGDPKDISKQQASAAGRLILAFQNTTMQQSRLVKKSYLDLKNGRGDAKTHISKIVYYLAVQNIIFSSLQSALFAVGFGSDDDDDIRAAKREEDKTKKIISTANSVIDGILRGTGLGGAIVATLKNVAMKYLEEKDKKFKADYAKVVLEAANISPPIGSKLRKMYSGFQQTKYDKDLIAERGWGFTQDGRVHLGPMYDIVGSEVEAFTNLPMARLANKVENISEAMNSENKAWQRVMVGLGWNPYTVGIEATKGDVKIKAEAKEVRKVEGIAKGKATREAKKIALKDSISGLSYDERFEYNQIAAKKKKEKRIAKAMEKRNNKK